MRTQEPKALWENFYSLTQIPRPSGKKEQIFTLLYQLLNNFIKIMDFIPKTYVLMQDMVHGKTMST